MRHDAPRRATLQQSPPVKYPTMLSAVGSPELARVRAHGRHRRDGSRQVVGRWRGCGVVAVRLGVWGTGAGDEVTMSMGTSRALCSRATPMSGWKRSGAPSGFPLESFVGRAPEPPLVERPPRPSQQLTARQTRGCGPQRDGTTLSARPGPTVIPQETSGRLGRLRRCSISQQRCHSFLDA